jgi:hypothetical protein
MSEGWVLLTARPLVQAQLLAGALESEGIAVRMQRNGLGAIYGMNTGAFPSRLYVAPGDLRRAQDLLAELEGNSV